MGYEAALQKAWESVLENGIKDKYLKFFNDEYEVDYVGRNIVSMSCNAPAKDHYKLLILHYLANENKVSKSAGDAWISFKELEGGETYFPAFKKRAINPVLRKYGDRPLAIFDRAAAFNAERIDQGSAAISINAFQKVKVAVILWAKDEEFPADCNMLFNPEIMYIFPTEDTAVLGGITASLL
ncbi:MAG: DUF3786 domain-containing protein [Candidatus Omnitrophota bacterium]|jgi:hypothetical protein